MNKLAILAGTACFVFGVTIVACNKKDTSEGLTTPVNTQIPILQTPALKLSIGASTDSLTDMTRHLGLTKVTLQKKLPDSTLEFLLSGTVSHFNGNPNFSLDGTAITLKGVGSEIIMSFGTNKRLHYDEVEKTVTLYYGNVSIPLDTNTGDYTWVAADEDEFTWGLILLDELVNNQAYRTAADVNNAKATRAYFILNGGWSRSTAERNTLREFREMQQCCGCVATSGVDVSCVWDNSICTGYMQMNCP